MRHKLGCSYVVVVITSSSGRFRCARQTDMQTDRLANQSTVHSSLSTPLALSPLSLPVLCYLLHAFLFSKILIQKPNRSRSLKRSQTIHMHKAATTRQKNKRERDQERREGGEREMAAGAGKNSGACHRRRVRVRVQMKRVR